MAYQQNMASNQMPSQTNPFQRQISPPFNSQQFGQTNQSQQLYPPMIPQQFGQANQTQQLSPPMIPQLGQINQSDQLSQPIIPQQFRGSNGQWSSGFFCCMDDYGICGMTCCCPCVQYGNNYAAIHGQGCFCQGCIFTCLLVIGCSCLVHQDLRRDIKERYDLKGGCNDGLTTCLCPVCAICQEAREIKNRNK